MTSPEDSGGSVRASLFDYKGRPVIRLEFKYDAGIITEIKKIRGRIYSATFKCWYIPDTSDNRRRYGLGAFEQRPDVACEGPAELSYKAVCESLLERMREKIIPRALSKHTLKNYINHIKVFLGYVGNTVNPMDMTKADIESYLIKRHAQNPTSESDRNSHINAIKFLYEQVLGHDKMLFYLPRPEKPLQLPIVLSEQELERLFRAVSNLKHKAILLTAFSCGLRVSEVCRLKVKHIDTDRMQVFIERSKGKKDRYVMLSPVLKDVLEKYRELFHVHPNGYLFEGQRAGDPYSTRSAQTIFNRAVKDAGIQKDVTFHVLRASFATHLLEKGVDIKYIKELLGHFDIKTTERYLHVAREKLVHIQSPLDFLNMGI